jgi:hypothetical protein
MKYVSGGGFIVAEGIVICVQELYKGVETEGGRIKLWIAG